MFQRQLIRVVYPKATRCSWCGQAREQLWLLSRGRGVDDDIGPFDHGCFLRSVYLRLY